ncbi:hypothetical protein GOOTI_254_00050 [Gordonia otitidis NBRC 100426]|uniref:Uncharacterized protein n=1 Tax=Gordonia otitidis (strain DSM 44809 / CCUG 52243 / JCM 12355 / NBRC 100426 / IFM 10032) TaxID=1108044 RepID=H5TU53_GORO1|nr:hypothetical protein GOOTI_254_00050 [Gordonia otitidis NBRC 100426]
MQVLLMAYDPLGEVEGVNQAARAFLAGVGKVPATVEAGTDLAISRGAYGDPHRRFECGDLAVVILTKVSVPRD